MQLGKVIGGGLPVGAYGGRKDIMQMVAPAGGVTFPLCNPAVCRENGFRRAYSSSIFIYLLFMYTA